MKNFKNFQLIQIIFVLIQYFLVDTRQPPAQPHLSREGKRGSRQRRVSRERQKEIERDNVILLQKMIGGCYIAFFRGCILVLIHK